MKSVNAATCPCGWQTLYCLNFPCAISAKAGPAQKIASLSWHLAQDIADDDEPENHGDEAAALFLLALRHNHACLERALNGCRITWSDNATTEKVEYLT
jgi:hypothetical protein